MLAKRGSWALKGLALLAGMVMAGNAGAAYTVGKWFDLDKDGVNDVRAVSEYKGQKILWGLGTGKKFIKDRVYVSPKAPKTLTKLKFDWKIDFKHRLAGTLPICSSNGWCYWEDDNSWWTIYDTPHKDFHITLDPTITPPIGKITRTAKGHTKRTPGSILDSVKKLFSQGATNLSVGGNFAVAQARRPSASSDSDVAQAGAMIDSEEEYGDDDLDVDEYDAGDESGDSEVDGDDLDPEYDDAYGEEAGGEEFSEAGVDDDAYGEQEGGEEFSEAGVDDAAGEQVDASDEVVWIDLKSNVSSEDGSTFRYTYVAQNNTEHPIQFTLETYLPGSESTLETKEYSIEPGESVLEEYTSEQLPYEVSGISTAIIEGNTVIFFAPAFVPYDDSFGE